VTAGRKKIALVVVVLLVVELLLNGGIQTMTSRRSRDLPLFSPRLCGTCLRSVLYPASLNSLCRAVSMCSCAPDLAPACCV
jgi:hypothetical protein